MDDEKSIDLIVPVEVFMIMIIDKMIYIKYKWIIW
jgi:hypothetical protein